jgi:hypothetical protein
MIGRALPSAADLRFEKGDRSDRDTFTVSRGTAHNTKYNETMPYAFVQPKGDKWNGTIALWLTGRGLESLTDGQNPSGAAKRLLDAGIAIACPTLYLSGATEQPMNLPKSKDPKRNEWSWATCYTYGYNPTLVAHRVHDAMLSVAAIASQTSSKPARVILVGTDGAGVVAAAAAAMLKDKVAGAVIDTEGFRFASLTDPWHPMFVPGAVKYGDVPALLRVCEPLKPTVLGEKGAPGGTDAVVAAVLKQAAQAARVSAN